MAECIKILIDECTTPIMVPANGKCEYTVHIKEYILPDPPNGWVNYLLFPSDLRAVKHPSDGTRSTVS